MNILSERSYLDFTDMILKLTLRVSRFRAVTSDVERQYFVNFCLWVMKYTIVESIPTGSAKNIS